MHKKKLHNVKSVVSNRRRRTLCATGGAVPVVLCVDTWLCVCQRLAIRRTALCVPAVMPDRASEGPRRRRRKARPRRGSRARVGMGGSMSRFVTTRDKWRRDGAQPQVCVFLGSPARWLVNPAIITCLASDHIPGVTWLSCPLCAVWGSRRVTTGSGPTHVSAVQ